MPSNEKHEQHSKQHSKKHRKAKTVKGLILAAVIIIIIIAVAVIINKFVLTKKEVAARVNGEPIYVDQVESTYNNLQDAEKAYVTKGVLLGLLIDNKILLQKAESMGITVTDSEVEAMVNAYKSYMPNGTFETQIASSTAKLDQFKVELKENIIIQKYIISQIPSVDASDAEISAFFEQYKQMFSGDLVRVSHILVSTEAEASAILAQLRSGSDFAELAKEKSIDSSAASGGDIGWFGHGATVPEFEAAAFNLSVGQISGVVQTQYGYHILKLTNRTSVKEPVLEDIKPLIKSSLVNQKVKADVSKFMELLTTLRNESKIEVLNTFGGTYTPENTTAGETTTTLAAAEAAAPTTSANPATTTTLASAKTCGEQHGIKDGTIIIYYLGNNDNSNEMMGNIDKLKAQGYTVFKVDKLGESQDGLNMVKDCFPTVDLQKVPQIICSQTGAVKVGLISWDETKAFADACGQ